MLLLHVFILITTQYTIHCQLQQRFYFFNFSGQLPSNWHNEAQTDYVGNGCPNDNKCLKVNDLAIVNASLSTLGYHTINLRIDVGTTPSYDPAGHCYIEYSSSNTSWVHVNLGGKQDATLDQTINLPDNNAYNNQYLFYLRLGNVGSEGARGACYFDDLEIFGMPYGNNSTSTIHPTKQTIVTTASNPTVVPTNSLIVETTTQKTLCLQSDTGFINTTYTVIADKQSCIDNVIDFLSHLMDVIRVIYSESALVVYSNMTKTDWSKFQQISNKTVCDDIVLNIITCFQTEIDVKDLLNVTNSVQFIDDINEQIDNNNTIIYISNTTIVFFYDTQVKYTNHVLYWPIIIGSCILMLSILIIFCICYKKHQKNERTKHQMLIRNPMVLLIGVGDYDAEPIEQDIDAAVSDLPVDIDINNLLRLFRDHFAYEIYPKYDKKCSNIAWSQEELINFLNEKAQIFEENVKTPEDDEIDQTKKNFDALFIALSAHGLNNSILTSDYKLVDKDVIHRIFSSYNPKSRTVPRIIMYDCCDGSDELSKGIKKINKESKYNEVDSNDDEKGKQFLIEDIPIPILNEQSSDARPQPIWQYNTQNPDHRLVTIHAANLGFQSKMTSIHGSYLIQNFVEKTLEGLKNDVNNPPFLYEIMDEIQHELGERKQLPICTYNNNTRFIKFVPNTDNVNNIMQDVDNVHGDDKSIEMLQIKKKHKL
eukprot:474263_1